jgi:hypothetical protein
MKKLTLIIIGFFFLFPSILMSQKSPATKFFNKYKNNKAVSSMIISTDALEIYPGSDEKANKLKFLSEQIEKIYVLNFNPDNSSSQEIKSFTEKFKKVVKEKRYEELFSLNVDDGVMISAYIVKGHGNKIKESVFFINSDKNTMMVVVTGEIDLKQVMELSSEVTGFMKHK